MGKERNLITARWYTLIGVFWIHLFCWSSKCTQIRGIAWISVINTVLQLNILFDVHWLDDIWFQKCHEMASQTKVHGVVIDLVMSSRLPYTHQYSVHRQTGWFSDTSAKGHFYQDTNQLYEFQQGVNSFLFYIFHICATLKMSVCSAAKWVWSREAHLWLWMRDLLVSTSLEFWLLMLLI